MSTMQNEIEFDVGVTAQDLIEAGVQYGSNFKSLTRSMEKYVYGTTQYDAKNNICIIDLDKTLEKLEEACKLLYSYGLQRYNILIVGTKDPIQEIVEKISLETRLLLPGQSKWNGFFYINKHFQPGLFTNFETFSKKMQHNERYKQNFKSLGKVSKSERKNHARIMKRINKDDALFKGVHTLQSLDEIKAVIAINVGYEKQCITEAQKVGIPVLVLADTDSDTRHCKNVIPCNDNTPKGVAIILEALQRAYMKGLSTGTKFHKRTFDSESNNKQANQQDSTLSTAV